MSNPINRSIKVNGKEVKNRIIMPPLVCFNWGNDKGFETVSRGEHYGKRAKGGTGFIIIEATAISKDGRITDTGLGLWSDDHISQFNDIAKSCHDEDAVVTVQLVHAGMKSVGNTVYSSSSMDMENKECFEMTVEQINEVKENFVKAAIRAEKAGLDGVEIHGAHGYLLSQFTSKETNKRTDKYGGSLDNRLRLPIEIVKEVNEATGDDFIIGYRFGVNDPTMEEDKYFAKKLEDLGVHLLNVSAGIGANDIEVPKDFPFSSITYMGTEIYKEVNIPAACVGGIRKPEDAKHLLENEMIDMVAVGRGLLADPDWTNRAINDEEVDICYHCSPRCKYAVDGKKCPWYR